MQRLKQLLGALRGARYVEWIFLMVVLAAAVLLLGRSESQSVQEAAATGLESRMESVLSCVAGAGRVRVMVNQEEIVPAFGGSQSASGGIVGVVVVAEGAGDLRVALELARAVQTLTGVDANAIEVMTMEGDRP